MDLHRKCNSYHFCNIFHCIFIPLYFHHSFIFHIKEKEKDGKGMDNKKEVAMDTLEKKLEILTKPFEKTFEALAKGETFDADEFFHQKKK
jgi:hypothetical protein